MLHAGLDLSRKKVDVRLLSEQGEHLDQLGVPPDVDSLRRLARRIDEVQAEPVSAVVESMTGARIVHDTLEAEGWAVEIADAQKVKGLAPLACKPDQIDSLVLATLSSATWCRRSGFPTPGSARSESSPAFASTLVKHRSMPKHRVHSTLIDFGRPCPVTDPFGLEGRELLERLEVPEPWRGNVGASVVLSDELERQIAEVNRRLRQGIPSTPTSRCF
jgi:transposase